MTMFNIDPPRAMLGAARAADEIDVEITWIVQRTTPQPTAPKAQVPDEHLKGVTELVDAYSAVFKGVSELDRDQVGAGVDSALANLESLEALDAEKLPEEIRTSWARSIDEITEAVTAVGDADSGSAVREALASLCDAMNGLLEITGHNHESTVMVYRYPTLRGVAGRIWLQPFDADGEIRSPYGRNVDNGAEIIAIYPGQVAGE